jgi:uncharacterized OsmC-like protein
MADPRRPAPPVAHHAATGEPGRVWVDRAGPQHYTGHNGRAPAIPIGLAGADGCFSPTELLRVALAGCAGLSADHVLTRRLGADARAHIAVTGDHDPAERRFSRLSSTITVDLAGLDPRAQEQLRIVVDRAVHRYCTVGRTLEQGAPVPVAVQGSA